MSAENEFRERFGCDPGIRVVSPGRINLIGEHVDYLGGEVMPIAIDRHVTVDAAASGDDRVEVFPAGLGLEAPAVIDLGDLSRRDSASESWLNYVIGVLSVYRDAGVTIPGFRALVRSDLPVGAGLSSSAALETSIALLVETLGGVEQDVADRALLCQRAEHEFAGVPCGIMDQLAVGAGRRGHVLRLDCADLSRTHVPLPGEVSVVVADTGVKHSLGDGEYEMRRRDCEEALAILGRESFRELTLPEIEAEAGRLGDRLHRRARHAVSEMERVRDFAGALERSDFARIGEIMLRGHESLRDDYEVSCPELDALVEAAYGFGPGRGLVGSRMTGGGFGGSTVSLVRTESAAEFRDHLENFHAEKFGRRPNCFITDAVDGARVVPITPNPRT